MMSERWLKSFCVGAGIIALLCGGTPVLAKKAARSKASRVPSATKEDSGEYVIEKRSDGSKVKYKKKTTYDFEGLGVDGMSNKPSGSYISNIKDVKARTIIRMRQNFDDEVIDSPRQMD